MRFVNAHLYNITTFKHFPSEKSCKLKSRFIVAKMNVSIIIITHVVVNMYFQCTEVQCRYQPLYVAIARSYDRAYNNENQMKYSSQSDIDEDSDENAQRPIKYGYQPLILVVMNTLLRTVTNRPNLSDFFNMFSIIGNSDEQSNRSLDLLSIPFKLLQTYGLAAASNYMPQLSTLQNYKIFYDQMINSSPSASSTGELIDNIKKVNTVYDIISSYWSNKHRESDAAEVAAEEAEDKDQVRQKFMKEPSVEGSTPTYAMFEKYYPYAKHAINIGTYFVPGLTQYKQVILGLEVMRIAWKTAEMYKNGENWMSMATHIGQEAMALGKRDDLETIKAQLAENAYIDVSNMDTLTFLKLVINLEHPPLPEKEGNIIRSDIIDVVNTYLSNDLQEHEKEILIKSLERTVKFIAFHAIIPAI